MYDLGSVQAATSRMAHEPVVPTVIARSGATKRSRVSRPALDCFASLAMTARRNYSAASLAAPRLRFFGLADFSSTGFRNCPV